MTEEKQRPAINELKRVQVNMSRDLRDSLRRMASDMMVELDKDDIGTGSVASMLLEALADSPDLFQELRRRVLEDSKKEQGGRIA